MAGLEAFRRAGLAARRSRAVFTLLGLIAGGWVAPVGDVSAADGMATDGVAAGLVVTFLGTTSALISDGETTLMTDGYFSRVAIGKSPESWVIRPDIPAIDSALQSLPPGRIAAVFVVHSHFDHAMDAPVVAQRTGALLVGSASTANVGRGLGLPEKQMLVVSPGDQLQFGQFKVHFYRSKHFPLDEPLASAMLGNTIDSPLVPPVRFDAYKEGTTFSILFEHPRGNLLLHGSAGYLPGALAGVKADAILLGTGGLGDLPREEQEAYYREVVLATGAKQVFPVHWDVMSTPYSAPLVPDTDFQPAMRFLTEMNATRGVQLALLPKGEPVVLNLNRGTQVAVEVPVRQP
jgi:L-ascorbate metabolism protein UlaG (beta-lactamase superfamily)